MRKYKATNIVTLRTGIVRLTDEQQASRVRTVNPSDNRTLMISKTSTANEFRIDGFVNFKIGEIFEWDSDATRMGVDEITEKSETKKEPEKDESLSFSKKKGKAKK